MYNSRTTSTYRPYNRNRPFVRRPSNRFVPRATPFFRGKKLYFRITRTKNNIIFKISHLNGIPLYQSTAGALGLPGSRRDSPTSADIATKKVMKKLEPYSDRHITCILTGPFDKISRAVIRSAESSGVIFSSFKTHNSATHNGVRSKKPRRV